MIHIENDEIEAIEELLLPKGCHFAEDAKSAIRCWSSRDIAACPGSGKTTVLLAKLKLLADRMPLDNGAGICVLSHTNIAVNEIKAKMASCTVKLMSYPNYVGTIQSFIDQYVTLPYLRKKLGVSVRPTDERTYAEHLCRVIHSGKYLELSYCVRSNYTASSGQHADEIDHISKLYCHSNGSLHIRGQNRALAGANRLSARQFKEAVQDVLIEDGFFKYSDAFVYAKEAIAALSTIYTDLFSKRFEYVFIDEYQDCYEDQRHVLHRLFDPTKCCVIRIGDSDQAIYNSYLNSNTDWIPDTGFLPIASSSRYSQEIADVLRHLRTGKMTISTSCGLSGCKPVLIVYDADSISSVIEQFIIILDNHGLTHKDGIYKAIGHIQKETSSGIRIGSYWSGYDGAKKQNNVSNYWTIIDEICDKLNDGKVYLVEPLVRKLVCRVFHYARISSPETGKEYTIRTIKQKLDKDFFEVYRNALNEIITLFAYDRTSINRAFCRLIDKLFLDFSRTGKEIMDNLPAHFLRQSAIEQSQDTQQNIYVDPVYQRKICFATVHGVKGETHDATLYLETETRNSSDIVRVLPYFGVGRVGSSPLYDYSRKLVYVGMSRPRKLLCVAVQESTYERSASAFQDWEVIDIRTR